MVFLAKYSGRIEMPRILRGGRRSPVYLLTCAIRLVFGCEGPVDFYLPRVWVLFLVHGPKLTQRGGDDK